MLVIEAIEQPRGYRLRGEVDIASADALARTLERAVAHADTLHLDLSEVTFLDSIGLAVVIRAALDLEGRGGVVLRGPLPGVRRLLDISGVLKVPNVELVD